MNGYELIVYGILKANNEPLYKNEIVEEMTFKNKKKEVINVSMSERTLKSTLKSLEEKNIIISKKDGKRKLYSPNTELDRKTYDKVNIPYGLVYDVAKQNLTVEELHFYCFLCYLQNEQVRNGQARGNYFKLTQEEIAKKYGVTRERICQLMEELDRKKYITRVKRTQNNGHDFYEYHLIW